MKMSLLDLSWFLLESEAIPVHGGFLYVFSPPAGAKPGYGDRIFASMSKRPVGAPFNLRPNFSVASMPRWEEVEVDVSRHVLRERLPSPGTERQLLAAAANAVDPPLPSSAPLWRFHWFDGLEGGRFAFLLTVHHAQWDGISMFRLMGEILPDSPQMRTVRAPWEGLSTWQRHDAPKVQSPSALRKATRAISESVRAVADVSKAFANHGAGLITGSTRRVMPFGAPETRPTRRGSNLRTYGLSRLPLSRVKALAKASESSVNDVLTAVVDGAYRAYLEKCGLPVNKALTALVPVALKVPGAGNQISGCVVKLGEPGSAPPKRLAEIKAAMGAGKSDIHRMGASGAKLFAMINMGVSAGPDILRVGGRMPVTANLLISNPYGIPKPLFLNGSRLEYFMPLVGPSLGVRLAVGFMSYADETYVMLISTRAVVPHVERLAQHVQRSFRELERAYGKPAFKPTAPVVRKKNTTRKKSRSAATVATA
jgi:diacylglycerol O-acyltransferase